MTDASEDHSQAAIEWLFIHTLEDLRRLVLDRTEGIPLYDLIRIGALMRLLIVDTHSLAERANRARRVPMEFTAHEFDVNWRSKLPAPIREMREAEIADGAIEGATLHLDGVIPGNDDTPIETKRISGWRNHTTGTLADGTPVSVHNVIDYVAHIAGGVHQGYTKSPVERALHMGADWWREDAPSARVSPLAAIHGLAVVTISGLDPLRDACLKG